MNHIIINNSKFPVAMPTDGTGVLGICTSASVQAKETSFVRTNGKAICAILLSIAVIGVPTHVTAQTNAPASVQLYGTIDAAVETLSNVDGTRLTRMPNITGSQPSRWGLRGSEDLGSGQRALFVLESGFGPDAGTLNQGGRAFGRAAYVGLSGSWGTVTVGRQQSMYALHLQNSGVLGPNAHGLGALDPYIPASRFDNSLAYIGRFGAVTLGAIHSLGRDAVGNCAGENSIDKKACQASAAMVKYDTPTWGAAAAWDQQHGGDGASAGLVRSDLTDTRRSVAAYAKLGGIKIGGGMIERDNEGAPAARRKSRLTYLEAGYSLTPVWALEGQISELDYRDSSDAARLIALRTVYSMSRRTAVYLTVGHINNSGSLALSASSAAAGGTPSPGGSQTGVAVGVRHAF